MNAQGVAHVLLGCFWHFFKINLSVRAHALRVFKRNLARAQLGRNIDPSGTDAHAIFQHGTFNDEWHELSCYVCLRSKLLLYVEGSDRHAQLVQRKQDSRLQTLSL